MNGLWANHVGGYSDGFSKARSSQARLRFAPGASQAKCSYAPRDRRVHPARGSARWRRGAAGTGRRHRRRQRPSDPRDRRRLVGSAPSMADGFARFGRAPTGTEPTKRLGFTTTARTRLLICAGKDWKERTRSGFTTSAGRHRTSRPSASERRTQRLWNFGTNCCVWR